MTGVYRAHLSLQADYSCRVLIYLATKDEGHTASIKEIADAYGISENHLMKVVHKLAMLGFIRTMRGRKGGIQMGKAASSIRLSDLIAAMEPNLHLVECFNAAKNTCKLTPACHLRVVLAKARDAFMRELASVTIADLASNKKDLTSLLSQG